MTGLKLRYDSREGTVEGQQGVEWRFRGDESARSIGVLLRKKKNTYSLDTSFSFLVSRSVANGNSADDLHPAVINFPNQFPFSLGLSSELQRKSNIWGFVNLGARSVSSSPLVPSGFESDVNIRQSLYRADKSLPVYVIEWKTALYIPVARLTTFTSTIRLGTSKEPIELGGPTYLPGTDTNALVAKRYAAFRQELRYVLAQDLKWDVLKSFLFEDMVTYGAHCVLFDTDKYKLKEPKILSLQSIQVGVQLLGAFFGAKNQSVSFEVARGLDEDPQNVFSVTIGKNL